MSSAGTSKNETAPHNDSRDNHPETPLGCSPETQRVASRPSQEARTGDVAAQAPGDSPGADQPVQARPPSEAQRAPIRIPDGGRHLTSEDQSRSTPADAPCDDVPWLPPKSGNPHSERAGGADTQVIFDERFALFMDPFGTTCDNERVPVAVAIVLDPKIRQGPLVMTRGHKYEVARVLAQLLRRIKAEINHDLDA